MPSTCPGTAKVVIQSADQLRTYDISPVHLVAIVLEINCLKGALSRKCVCGLDISNRHADNGNLIRDPAGTEF